MIDYIAIELNDHYVDIDIDHESCSWAPVGSDALDALGESAFPLAVMSGGRRYELFSDGSFAEAEHGENSSVPPRM